MNISLDIFFPPIIAGMLITMILSSNIMVMKSTNENRLTYELQNLANTSLQVLQEEVRGLDQFINQPVFSERSELHFTTLSGDTVNIYQDERNLIINKKMSNGTEESEQYALRLYTINFTRPPESAFLEIETITESAPEHEIGEQNQRFRAIAERSIYLRNLSL